MKRVFVFLILTLFSLIGLSSPIDVRTYIPKKAYTYVPLVRQEQLKLWSDHPEPNILGGMGEQESCISLTHSKCWDATVKLATSRELGAGIFQLTKTYNKDGSIRFDAMKELKDVHPNELKELNWNSIFVRPDLQIKAFILKNKDNFKSFHFIKDTKQRLIFSVEAYNRGVGGVSTDRRICGLKKNCDPNVWFNNVELTCGASKAAIYGNRGPCNISREYIVNIFTIRSEKYKPFFK